MTIARVRILVCDHDSVRGRGGARPTSDIEAESALLWLAREFPSIEFHIEADGSDRNRPVPTVPTVDLETWQSPMVDFATLDARVEDLSRGRSMTLVVRGGPCEASRATHEMLTRWQRLVRRRNSFSATDEFDALLARFDTLHDSAKPLAVADRNHAVDVWQWMLRLEAGAKMAVQMAALLHDIERLESEVDVRREHLAEDYTRFKEAHARRGAEIARAVLAQCGTDLATRERVAELVAGHERPDDDADRRLLADADALSFFSQNSAGYYDYFGPQQTARKIAWTLARMRAGATDRLATVRLRADVGHLLEGVRRREPSLQASSVHEVGT